MYNEGYGLNTARSTLALGGLWTYMAVIGGLHGYSLSGASNFD